MKKTLTDADRLELKSKLKDQFSDRSVEFPSDSFRENVLNGLVEFFSDFYESKNTFTDGIAQEREEETEDPDFKGVAYEKDIDQKALKQGFYTVFEFMVTHPQKWWCDAEISALTGVYIPSVQRYRSYMRQPEFGGHIVERRRRAGMRIWEYKLIPNEQSKIWQKFQLSRI